MSDHNRRSSQVLRGWFVTRFALQFLFYPWRTDGDVTFSIQGIRKIKNCGPGLEGALPVPASKSGVGGKEGKIDVAKMFGVGGLDNCGFVAHLIELAKRFIVVEQLYVGDRKIHLIENFLELATLQRGSPYDRNPEDVRNNRRAIHAKSTPDSVSYPGAAGRFLMA